MDLHQLMILRELGERGSVAAVARALFVTPSAVSQHLSALQRDVAVTLTEKRGRTLALTPAGVALARAAVGVSVAMAEAERAVDEFRADSVTPVTVSAFHSAGFAWFGALLTALGAGDGPPVSVSDEDIAQTEFSALVADYDLVVAHRIDHEQPWPEHLAVTPLIYERFDVAIPRGHPLAARCSLTVSDVADERWISPHSGFPVAGALNVVAVAAGRPLNISHRINEFFVAGRIVAAGGALALMPRDTMKPGPDAGYVLRPFESLRIGRQIDVLSRPETLLRASVRTVLDTLIAVAVPVGSPAG
ncbi:LysR family transcriptional regulator [Leifsonia kafniensis]|uniref:LysR family transcriptional regulator n=1 Tax=Leifsonia kafniensis TaxID=475957 RepID=A0ABP7KAZ3_9MICO